METGIAIVFVTFSVWVIVLLLSGGLVAEISKYFTFAHFLSVHLVCLAPLPILNGYALLAQQKSEPFDLAGATTGVLLSLPCVGQVSPAVTSFLWPDIITYNFLQCVHLVAATHSPSWSLTLLSSWVHWCLRSTESSCSICMYGILAYRDWKKKQEWISLLLNRFLLIWIPWIIFLSSYWSEVHLQTKSPVARNHLQGSGLVCFWGHCSLSLHLEMKVTMRLPPG